MLAALAGAHDVTHVLLTRSEAGADESIRARTWQLGVPVRFVARAELDELALGRNHQGVAALIQPVSAARLEDLLEPPPGAVRPALFLAADRVQDVGNLGSLVRTLDAVGGTGLLLPARHSAGIGGGLARASAGASLRTRIVRVPNLARTLRDLGERGVQVVGLSPDAERDFHQLQLHGPCCLVVGSESRGLRRLVSSACSEIVRIPMLGGVGSLNAAVAGGLVLYHVARSRWEVSDHDE